MIRKRNLTIEPCVKTFVPITSSPMKSLLAFLLCGFCVCTVFAIDDYKPGPNSERHDGVPRGKLTDFEWTNSTVFPGTTRKGWIYVPAQYDASKPAAVMVFQDGGGYVNEKETSASRLYSIISSRAARCR